MDAGTGGHAGGFDLGGHAARAHAGLAGAADRDAVEVVRAGDVRNPLGAVRRRAVVQGVDVGQQHECVGADQVGHQGREAVVVAEADLVGGHGVVFVDHRDDAEVQQPVQRAERVGVLAAPHEVIRGQQHLADGDPVRPERVGVAGHQQALAHAGGGLLGGEVAGALLEAQRGEAGGDRAGGHQDDFRARVALVRQGVGEAGQGLFGDPALDGGQRGRAHLDDDPAGPGQRGAVRGVEGVGSDVLSTEWLRPVLDDGLTRHRLRPVHSP